MGQRPVKIGNPSGWKVLEMIDLKLASYSSLSLQQISDSLIKMSDFSLLKAVRSFLTCFMDMRLLVAGERVLAPRNRELTGCSRLWIFYENNDRHRKILQWPADCIENAGSERLVLQPVSVLDDVGVGGEEEGQSLRDPGGGGCQGVVGVRGEAGPEWGQDGKWVKYLTTSDRNS